MRHPRADVPDQHPDGIEIRDRPVTHFLRSSEALTRLTATLPETGSVSSRKHFGGLRPTALGTELALKLPDSRS